MGITMFLGWSAVLQSSAALCCCVVVEVWMSWIESEYVCLGFIETVNGYH